MAKRPFIRKKKRQVSGTNFWDKEYQNATHLKLSTEPSADLEKFMRWLERQKNPLPVKENASVLDLGAGNGRNLIYLAKNYELQGIGYDISTTAIKQAVAASEGLDLQYKVRSIADSLDLPDESQRLVLDMMTSHFLNQKERLFLRDEIYRVLEPGGWFFLKTFLADDDLHTRHLLKNHPGKEASSYIHPVMGVAEFVYTEEELVAWLQPKFKIRQIYRSHKHKFRGRARKRRTISIYAEKDYR